MYIRGCEIEGLLDETGKLIEEGKLFFEMYASQSNIEIYSC